MTTTAIQVPAGWYPDPIATAHGGEATHRRWWDGAQWTEHVEALAPMPAPAPREPLAQRVYTASVWLMATMPFTQALLIFAVFTSLPPESSAWTRGLTLIFPFILYAALAGQDTRLMALAGHLRTAPWVTALVVPPVYLAVRSARIGLTTGAIAWPLYVWLVAQAAVIGTWWALDPAGVLATIEPLL